LVRANGHGSASQKLGVLVAVSDFPVLAIGLRAVIDAEADMHVVGEIDAAGPLREQLEPYDVDVVITECLPVARAGCSSFANIEQLRALRPGLRIIVLECRCSSEQFSLALKAGADGFLTREALAGDIVAAVRCVSRGQTYVSPAIVTRMVNTYVLRSPAEALEDPYDALSERDREVLLLAAIGHTNREIARTLHLSEQTVHNYRATIMEKFGFHDRIELLKYSIRRGLINISDL
jgi:two-component system, NarL family, response regulator NreC